MKAKQQNLNRIKRGKKDWVFDATVYLICIVILLIVLYPMYFVLIASISNPNAVNLGQVDFFPIGLSLKGYETLFQYKDLWIGYRNTIFYAGVGTLFSLIVNLTAGYALSRTDMYGYKLINVFFLIPMFFGGGLIPSYLNIRNLGLYNTVWSIVIPGAVSIYNIIVARTFFKTSIPDELWEAAQIDGMGSIGYFTKIVLPLSKAIIAVLGLWCIVGHWNSYFTAMIYLRDENLRPLQLVIRSILINSQTASTMLTGTAADEAREMAELVKYSVIVISSLPVMCIYPFVQKYFNKGVMIGSLKG